MSFSSLPAPLLSALTARGYAEPTAVQAAVLNAETAGRDLLVSAQTGSGKTVAFGLAMANELLGDNERLPHAGAPLALIVAPTRELALQVREELTWLYASAGGRVASCVGGTDPVQERRVLNSGAHIVVGTPGRLRDHIERGNLNLSNLRVAVLDEADEMLDLGFREELEAILDASPAEQRRTLLFSATVPHAIASLAKRYQRDAMRIEATARGQAHGDIEHRAMLIVGQDIERCVVNALRLENPRIAMVFCATRASVTRLHSNLTERGFTAVALSGELSQAERSRALQNLRDGRARVCVATDVAARGIDLPDLGLVIHAELPRDPETLLHRSGRTGRAGRKGISLFLVPHSRRRLAERLLDAARVRAEWVQPPTADAVHAKDGERLVEQTVEMLAEEAAERDQAIARALLADERMASMTQEQLATALIRVLRAPLPAPEELLTQAERPRREYSVSGEPAPANKEGVWFRLDVGRDSNADPRWLLPLLCRRGDVSRKEIGRIRIQDNETVVEVAPYAAAHFAEAINRPSAGEDAQVEITALGAVPEVANTPRPAPRDAFQRPHRGGPRHDGPRHEGHRGDSRPGYYPPRGEVRQGNGYGNRKRQGY
ncbi:DEAD/DEAH box helicase [Acetobacteraceae bacterium H6797]|nr:DEAD/DEAH box helicase [Acetobacteraceae bacterium H6797]